jgi:cytochrome c-type biogenesis protein CcmH
MSFFNHFDLLNKGARAPSFRLFSGERVGKQVPGPATKDRSNFTSFSFCIKTAQALLLAVAVCFSMGATDASSRFNDLGHRMMCTCGCAQLLGECNHVGCPESGRERNELSAAIAAGLSDKEILAAFSAKYGATVLAAPTTQGFDLVAWIAPFAVFAAALLGTILLVRRWAGVSVGNTKATAGLDAANEDPAERARREKIRRETGSDGGF